MERIIKLVAIVVAITALALVGAAIAESQDATPTPTASPESKPASKPPTYWERHGCKKRITKEQYRRKLRSTYRFWVGGHGGDYRAVEVTKRQRKKLHRMRECSLNGKVRARRQDRTADRRERWAFHRHIDQITPFGEWAIPPYIVMCESSGVYTKWNSGSTSRSRASGAYQYLESTWDNYGGEAYADVAAEAPPYAQHIIANRTYKTTGVREWMCA
jgi:hypothetical protein